jgi:RNA polymerase sigma-70 factor (sigma-E family)
VKPLTDAPPDQRATLARAQVTVLYQAHALGLVRFAKILLGDQAAAEDVVQDAFLGLYRRWDAVREPDKVLGYLRASVVNACRVVQRSRARRDRALLRAPAASVVISAEDTAIIGEANRELIAALLRLPARQREALVLRHYLGLTEDEAAQAMNVSRGTVKSATSRGRTALARMLKEDQ